MKEIQEVTTTGITYIDDDGKTSSINLESCYRNFLSLAGRQPQNDIDILKPVGFRKFSATPPYVELCTIPAIRFEFSSPNKYYELNYRLRKAGWRTIDGD